MMYHHGYGPGLGWLVMATVMIGIAGLVAAAVIALARGARQSGWEPELRLPSAWDADAGRVLADRFVRGEIDAEEYEQRLHTLRTLDSTRL